MSSSPMVIDFTTRTRQKLGTILPLGALLKSLAILLGFVLLMFCISFQENTHLYQPSDLLANFTQKWSASIPITNINTPTNISHIVFGIVGSMNTWKHKNSYLKSWWRPNVTRGYLFLDREPTIDFLPWSSSYPPFRVNEDFTKLSPYQKTTRPDQVRIVRTVMETFKQGDEDVRWYVMADDDTIVFVDNLAEVLAKYDHTKYMYIGANSECIISNFDFSFDMAFGGAGYALSYPLAAALAKVFDKCIQRYINLWVSDFMLYSCLSDLGVSRTHQKGFHQIDLFGDISGLLSSHPQIPLLSLHHLDTIDPIFPFMNRSESINHLMKASKVDHSRLLQQTICHHRPSNWSFSVSWGYSVHIYENIFPRSYLRKPLETFRPWREERPPLYMFNTRPWPPGNPSCEAPHVFFFDSIEKSEGNQIVTTYVRASPRGLASCTSSGNLSADPITKIQVFSSAATKRMEGVERDCCSVLLEAGMNTTKVIYRACMKDEIIS